MPNLPYHSLLPMNGCSWPVLVPFWPPQRDARVLLRCCYGSATALSRRLFEHLSMTSRRPFDLIGPFSPPLGAPPANQPPPLSPGSWTLSGRFGVGYQPEFYAKSINQGRPFVKPNPSRSRLEGAKSWLRCASCPAQADTVLNGTPLPAYSNFALDDLPPSECDRCVCAEFACTPKRFGQPDDNWNNERTWI